MGWFTIFKDARRYADLAKEAADSGEFKPRMSKTFSSKREADEWLSKMHIAAKMLGSKDVFLPRASEGTDGTWNARLWQIPHADLDRWEAVRDAAYNSTPHIHCTDDPEIEVPAFLQRKDKE